MVAGSESPDFSARTGFRDVKAEILRRIRARIWPPGSQLPAEVELAEEFGCARATVNRAMRELSEDGILDRKRKTGTRVNLAPVRQAKFEIPLVRAEVEAGGSAYRYALVDRDVMPAPDWLRARLDLRPDNEVLHVTCMHFADNTPFQFEDRWINIAAVPGVVSANFTETGPNEWLVDAVPFTDVEICFSAVAADDSIAAFLSLQPGAPVFVTERTTWLSGEAVTYARLCFHGGYKVTTRY